MASLRVLLLNISKATLGSFLLGFGVSARRRAIDDDCPIIVASSKGNSHWVTFKHELFKAFD